MFEKKIERDDAITAITERRDVSIVVHPFELSADPRLAAERPIREQMGQ